MTLLAYLKSRKCREIYIYIYIGEVYFKTATYSSRDDAFQSSPRQNVRGTAPWTIQLFGDRRHSEQKTSEPGRHPTYFFSFLPSLSPFSYSSSSSLSPSPFLQRCWPARNSTSPLNNGGTLTIFAAVYQDLDPNGSLGEYSFLPAAFSSRPLDENLRMPRINGRLPSSGQTDRDSCQPLPPSVHYVRLSSAAPLLIPSILLREESLRANFSFLPERARRFVMGYINLDFRESNKFSNCKQNFCRSSASRFTPVYVPATPLAGLCAVF